MLVKNETYTMTCVDYTHEGLGVCKVDGYPVFVKDMMKDETGEVLITRTKKTYAYGRLMNVNAKSLQRVSPPCAIYKKCGGCQIQHMSLNEQNAFKKERVNQAFKKFSYDLEVNDVLQMDNPWNYRNKVQVPFQKMNNDVVYGFYKPRSHDIIPMDECLIQNDASNKVLKRIKELILIYGIELYNEKSHSGVLRHVVTRYSFAYNELMVVFVTNKHKFKINDIIKQLTSEFPMIKTIVQNVNEKKTNVILGEQDYILYGEGYILDRINDIDFKISARSFYQVNPPQTEVLYNEAIKLANLSKEMIVLDTYCGIGTIGLTAAKHVDHVYGVEINEQAIEDAHENARLNKINNATFVCGDAKDIARQWKEEGIKPDVVFVDPPRKGCSQEFLDDVAAMNPKKIVYISCDVSTQARDVAYLKQFNYTTNLVQPVDLFPQTYHIESVLVLEKE